MTSTASLGIRASAASSWYTTRLPPRASRSQPPCWIQLHQLWSLCPSLAWSWKLRGDYSQPGSNHWSCHRIYPSSALTSPCVNGGASGQLCNRQIFFQESQILFTSGVAYFYLCHTLFTPYLINSDPLVKKIHVYITKSSMLVFIRNEALYKVVMKILACK